MNVDDEGGLRRVREDRVKVYVACHKDRGVAWKDCEVTQVHRDLFVLGPRALVWTWSCSKLTSTLALMPGCQHMRP